LAAKDQLHQRSVQMQQVLAERFPNCITLSGRRLPMKVGIYKDILAAAPDLDEVEFVCSQMLRYRTSPFQPTIAEVLDALAAG
jgi:sRNA-binding protein